ncbi:hypothetical protein [Cellulomonas dongxiuzhuiae]|uniref:Uncharacterized protein n=1 Tax=Cellulomonas dongxiuzhuiae TaxID=2819979 RepID=A0ABX8GLK2_9CELL|nr:hypothetical protein [Cellulomonas dongxiuzhuiae]MBO3095616.1 hypothetical protein [Cellulomonas dongxiuzhuiae]QWC16582.1 hypothetical protein KKR89_02635 [Cellulomonas dongxiuzhuiae]
MPTELVLLSDVAPSPEVVLRAAAVTHPDGSFLEYHDGLVRQLLDADGRALLALYPSRPVLDPTHAAGAVQDPPATFALWTDLTIPFGDPTDGRALAEAVAAAVGGVVKDRI